MELQASTNADQWKPKLEKKHDPSPVEPFTRFINNVKVGMNKAQILPELDRQFPVGGPCIIPIRYGIGTDTMSIRLDPNNAADNAEFVSFKMKGGQVVSKGY